MNNELMTDKQIKLFEAISKSGELIFACGSCALIQSEVLMGDNVRKLSEKVNGRPCRA